MNMMHMLSIALAFSSVALAEPGIHVTPDANAVYTYSDDFQTPRVLLDASIENAGPEIWMAGSLVGEGPSRNRTATYRFVSDRVIAAAEIRVEQKANARHLGGVNTLFLSRNGLDWTLVGSSQGQEQDPNGWVHEPFAVAADEAFTGGTELWVRLVLDNYTGLKTYSSSHITALNVSLNLGDAAAATGADPLQARWEQLLAGAGGHVITTDAPNRRRTQEKTALWYLEDVDGSIVPIAVGLGVGPAPSPVDAEGLRLSTVYRLEERPFRASALFVDGLAGHPCMVRITVRATKNAHRQLRVSWNGAEAAVLDAGSYFDQEREFYVPLAAPDSDGPVELRIAAADAGGETVIKRIEIAGPAARGWAASPPLPEGARVEVLSAEYLPDPEPPAGSQVVEGRNDTPGLNLTHLQRMYDEYAEFGALRVCVRNAGDGIVRIGDQILLNREPIEKHYVNFLTSEWDAHGVVWYRVRPRTLAPGECGEVYVRFRRHLPGESVSVEIPVVNGPSVTAEIPYAPASASIDYVTASPDFQTLYVYARNETQDASPLTGVSLDGVSLPDAVLYGADYPGGVALAVVKLDQPLREGDYHVAGATDAAGRSTHAQFRVLPYLFPRSSIHVPAELAGDMHMNLLTWLMTSQETCEIEGLTTSCMHTDVFRMHPLVKCIFAPDEADAKDNRGGGYDKGLGWHARMLAESGWQELVARHTPPVFSWYNSDGTTRPLNWGVYGRFADVTSYDPYPVTYFAADHAYVRESLEYVRQCAMPARLYAILEAYGFGSGQGVPAGARGPIPEEYRQNIVQAIGCGMKGLTSWVYSAGAGGWQLNELLQQEIAQSNALIAQIEDLLLMGTPAAFATCDAGTVPTGVVDNEAWPKERVWTGSLLCGPDAVVVAVVNHIGASKPGPPVIAPAKNVTVKVALPGYLREVEAFEATPDGLVPYEHAKTEGGVAVSIEELVSGRVFVLRKPAGG